MNTHEYVIMTTYDKEGNRLEGEQGEPARIELNVGDQTVTVALLKMVLDIPILDEGEEVPASGVEATLRSEYQIIENKGEVTLEEVDAVLMPFLSYHVDAMFAEEVEAKKGTVH